MSKIGKKPIPLSTAKINFNDGVVRIDGPSAKFEHSLPSNLSVVVEDKKLFVFASGQGRKDKMDWGLHRSLLSNKVKGAEVGFEQKLTIVGLGFKAQISGKNVTFTLGYTHKIDYVLPDGVLLSVDKTGQQLLLKSTDKFLLGNVADVIRSFRPPEPYKGTGIVKDGEIIIRKAGKTKAG